MSRQSNPKEDLIMELKAGVYRHYKGGLYQAIGIGRNTETEELMVAYISLTGAHLPGPRLNFRPAAMWFEQVEVDGKKVPRFEYIGIEAKQE